MMIAAAADSVCADTVHDMLFAWSHSAGQLNEGEKVERERDEDKSAEHDSTRG